MSASPWHKSSSGHWVLLIKDKALAGASGQPSAPLLLLIKGEQHELVGLKCTAYNFPEKAARHIPDNGIDFFFIGRVWHGARAMNPVERRNNVDAVPVERIQQLLCHFCLMDLCEYT